MSQHHENPGRPVTRCSGSRKLYLALTCCSQESQESQETSGPPLAEFGQEDICTLLRQVLSRFNRDVPDSDLRALHVSLTEIWMERVESVEVLYSIDAVHDSVMQAAFRLSSPSWTQFKDLTKNHLKVSLNCCAAF